MVIPEKEKGKDKFLDEQRNWMVYAGDPLS
jgi:hypothetical protein